MDRDLFAPAMSDFEVRCAALADEIARAPLGDRIAMLNLARAHLHQASPFRDEPVDFVRWVPADTLSANAYNPNTVAPPEMRLLKLSIEADGYTQPIVSFASEDRREVVDGFHRNRVGRETPAIRARIHGHLPVVDIKAERSDEGARRASTIRHNRARGKHGVEAMRQIVVDLVKRRWSDDKIAKELGMDADEVLRLKQIGGLAELFAGQEFSEAWDV